MASFTNRGTKQKPSWQYTISRMVNGKPDPIRKGGFRSQKEAKVAAAEIEDRLNKRLPVQLKLEPINEYFKKWVNLYKSSFEDGTQVNYKYTLDAIEEHLGSTPLQHIRVSDYQVFLNEFGTDKSRETVKKVNSHIRACVLDALDDGVLHVNFTRKAVIPGKKGKTAVDKHIDYFESKKLINALYDYLEKEHRVVYYMILLAVTSGMRYAELIALTRADFDFKSNTISVTKSRGYSSSTGEGERKTKTESSIRFIEMDKRTMAAFEKFFEETPDNIHRLVFYNPASKYKVYSNIGVNKALKKLLTGLKIKEISIHGLRHTHASILLYKEVSIQYISERLGHADVDTTIRVYAHMMKEMRVKDIKKTTRIFEAL